MNLKEKSQTYNEIHVNCHSKKKKRPCVNQIRNLFNMNKLMINKCIEMSIEKTSFNVLKSMKKFYIEL